VKILQNFDDRRIAVKFFDKGFSIKRILKKVNRSRSWLYKWIERFNTGGKSALKDLPKTPKEPASKFSKKMFLWF
jgi:transposase